MIHVDDGRMFAEDDFDEIRTDVLMTKDNEYLVFDYEANIYKSALEAEALARLKEPLT